MTIDEGGKPEGALERSPNAGEGGPSGVEGNSLKRFSVQRKMAIVACLLRGDPLDLVARETNFFVRNSIAPACARGTVSMPQRKIDSVPGLLKKKAV